MTDIYDEVNEELQAEQLRNALLRYGPLLIGLAVAMVIAVGAWQFWHWRQTRQAERDGTAYFQAMQLATAPDTASHQRAVTQFTQLAETGNAGYRSLSRLYAAGLQADTNLDAASKLWDVEHDDAEADPALRGLAALLWARHHLDKGDPAAVLAHLAPLREFGNPWASLAEECAALLDIRLGHVPQARRTLHALADDNTAPVSVRDRANLLLEDIGS